MVEQVMHIETVNSDYMPDTVVCSITIIYHV